MVKCARGEFVIKKVIVVLVMLIIFIGGMTWFYPQSFFSVADYAFEPDSGEVAGYQEDLDVLEESIGSDSTKDTAVMRAESVYYFYNLRWLREPVDMDDNLMEKTSLMLSSAREDVMNLMVRENYNEASREWLALTSYNLINAEIRLARLSESNWHSRKELNYEFRRVHQSIANSLDHFNTFFERRATLGSEQ